jgi:hypothetical protein
MSASDRELEPREIEALRDALDDEYKAQATYLQVIDDFGAVYPFVNIVEAESRHIAALTDLMQRFGLSVPANPWHGRVPRFGSVAEACAAAIDAEKENVALYDRLVAATDRPDIGRVLRNLQEASQQNHLPAFRRCSERYRDESGYGRGRGGHRHRGRL